MSFVSDALRMKHSLAAASLLFAALFSAGASAQLKPSSGLRLKPPTAPQAAAQAPAASEAAKTDPAAAEKEKAGALAAAGWLLLLDRRDWGTAWETSSSVFRGTVPLDKWMDAIPKLRTPLGNMVERKQVEAVYKTTLQGRPNGEYVTVLFDTKFDKKQVRETITTVRDTDGHWRVTGYSAG